MATDGIPADLLASVRDRRPDADPAELVAASWPDARRMVEGHLAAGLTKFVIRPADPTGSFDDFLHRFTEELLPLQN